MTGTKTYTRAALIDMCGGSEEAVKETLPWHDLRNDGLWLGGRDVGIAGVDPATMQWHPRKNSEVAALPLPFAACQLAAFFLAGGGLFLYERFDFEALDAEVLSKQGRDPKKLVEFSEPYRDALRDAARDAPGLFEKALHSLGDNADEAREVLREAIKLRRMADDKFGRSDDGVRESARWLLNDAYLKSMADSLPTPASTEPDWSMLATRAQLVTAFSAFTGMDKTWFDNLKDTPRLLAARKVKGRGQRGRTAQPLFCPMAVMTWLMDPKRKKGRAFHNNFKPWELLEKHFPFVYDKHSVGDPRQV